MRRVSIRRGAENPHRGSPARPDFGHRAQFGFQEVGRDALDFPGGDGLPGGEGFGGGRVFRDGDGD